MKTQQAPPDLQSDLVLPMKVALKKAQSRKAGIVEKRIYKIKMVTSE
jgi:hypothetical protein